MPLRFCAQVRDSVRNLSSVDFPRFVWDESKADGRDLFKGLFQSAVLLNVSVLFTIRLDVVSSSPHARAPKPFLSARGTLEELALKVALGAAGPWRIYINSAAARGK